MGRYGEKKKKYFLLVMRTLRFTLNNFHVPFMAIAIMLYITFIVLIYVLTGGLYFLT